MATFEGEVLRQTIAVAASRKIEPPALLAVVEVESAGKSLEQDGRTPCLLFERHVFYRELKKRFGADSAQLRRAVNSGLANSSWQPKTQYKDQGKSASRLDLFRRACEIDRECAIRSCSWGVGQTMGFLAEELKFKNAIQMFEYMVAGGVPAQVECMIREIERKRMIPKLNAHDWAGFAYLYNGAGYKKMSYDTKMAAAYLKWKKVELPKAGPVAAPAVKPQVPAELRPAPQAAIPPQAPKITQSSGGLLAGGAAFLAGLLTWLNSPQGQVVGLAVMIMVMAVITYFVVKNRRAREPQLGVLTEVDEDLVPAVVTKGG